MRSPAGTPVKQDELGTFFRAHAIDTFAAVPASSIHDPPGRRPADLFPSCRTMIIFGRVMGDELFFGSYKETGPKIRMLKQDLFRTSADLVRLLEDRGAAAVAVNSVFVKDGKVRGSLSLKHCAEDAGIGIIGDNTILISPRFGNRLGLGAVLTDREIVTKPVLDEAGKLCTHCGACRKACPTGALRAGNIDMFRCKNITGAVPSAFVPLLYRLIRTKALEPLSTAIADHVARGSMPRCSACLMACPHFKKQGR